MRRSLLIALLIVTPLGFATKLYAGPGAAWFNNSAGGLLYEVFWILAVLFAWPRLSALRVAVGVFLATCIIEALQLWHPAPLEALRDTFLGATLLGTTFTWWDFPHYALGCVAGWWLARHLGARPS